jgi:hypothetical protein
VLTLFKRIDNQNEIDKGKEDKIELFEPGEDSPEAFQPAEKPLDFVAFLVEFAVVFPWIEPVGFGWNHWDHAQIQHQLSRFVALVGLIHQHWKPFRHRTKFFQESSPLWRIVRVAGRQSEDYSRSSIRGNHMNLGVPPAT